MIAKLEQFVYRMAEDQEFRDMAARNPEAAVALYGLRGPERHGALKLCSQMSATTPVDTEGFWH